MEQRKILDRQINPKPNEQNIEKITATCRTLEQNKTPKYEYKKSFRHLIFNENDKKNTRE